MHNNVCVHVYIYIYVCACVYVCVYVYVCLCTQTFIYLFMHISIHIYIYVCIYISLSLSLALSSPLSLSLLRNVRPLYSFGFMDLDVQNMKCCLLKWHAAFGCLNSRAANHLKLAQGMPLPTSLLQFQSCASPQVQSGGVAPKPSVASKPAGHATCGRRKPHLLWAAGT